MSMFQKATKEQSKLRLAIYGPSGGGKTYTSLALAQGIASDPSKIFLLDTEFRSASKYADYFEFMTASLSEDKGIDNLIYSINESAKAGAEVLIIDSLSHAWKELLAEVDKLAQAKFKGNTWAAWSEGTPKQQRLIDSILSFPGHLIATIRAKTEWTKDEKGTMQRVGLAPEQGKGIEYEFDMLMSITTDHVVFVEKDRTGKFQDKLVEKPGPKFGKDIAEWLSSGTTSRKEELLEHLQAHGLALYGKGWEEKKGQLTSYLVKGRTDTPTMLTETELDHFVRLMEGRVNQQAEQAKKQVQPEPDAEQPIDEPKATESAEPQPTVYPQQEELVLDGNGVDMSDWETNQDDDLPF